MMKIKDEHAKTTSFSRAVIAGLICGIIAALLNVIYEFFYRKITGLVGDKLISPLPIYVGFPILMIAAGVIFLGAVEFIRRGRLFFTIFFLSLTLLAIVFSVRSANGVRGLLLGMEIITGLLISFLLPFLATHPKIFMEQEELSESSL
jgi:hypothetical protein